MRTKYCGKIKISDIDKEIVLCGWVNKTRNLGKFIFIDIRDQTGIVQILFHPKYKLAFQNAKQLKNEFCIKITGIVKKRIKENKNILTGKIEILAHELIILNTSLPLPINIHDVNEDIMRLKYRYLDLRSFKMINNLKTKNKIIYIIHKFMKKNHFLNIETPILTKSTPEGAKDYLIASRIHKQKYYALPQSPQLFKQILMISGIDKYYQIAKCFRDEDLRSDRQPEFTQIDLEASFITSKEIMNIIENLIIKLWKKIINYHIKKIPVISFKESMEKYKTDKPDLRNPLTFINLKHTKLYSKKKYSYKTNNIQINALLIPNGIYKLQNEKINFLNKILQKYQEIKYIYIYILNLKSQKYKIFQSNKNQEYNLEYILKKIPHKNGDIILIISGTNETLNNISNTIRMKIGKLINIININQWKPVWIINFPMFTKNQSGQLSSVHHPFTAPKNINIKKLQEKPESIISDSYDLVINGYEIGGGSVRIHQNNIQEIILKLLNINFSNEDDPLYFFVNALKYGTPPHAGIALGLDRITMLLTNSNNIKDVIAFPKTNSANCIMTGAPSKQKY